MATENSRKTGRLPDFSKAKQMEWRRKMMVFSFFLIISIIIWLLNALNKDYTTELKYPVTYNRFPENKVLISDVPDHLLLKITAHGYAILSYRLTNRPIPINFRLTSYAMNRMAGDSTRFFMLTRYAREEVSRQLPREFELLEISPDSLIFQFANEVNKTVKIMPELSYELGRDFTIKGEIRTQPDSLTIFGPDIYLDTISVMKTKRKNLGLLDKSYSGVLDILKYPRVNSSVEQVKCSIDLEKLTEVQIMVPIQLSGVPDSLRLQTFPQQVRVTGKIGLSNYERIVPEAFWIEVNYAEVLENKTRLQVKLRTWPDELSGVDYYPRSVEYLLSVK